MNYLLDTNVIVDHFRGRKPILQKIVTSGAAISIITMGELLYGTYKSDNKTESLKIVQSFIKNSIIQVLPVAKDHIVEFARLKSLLEDKGKCLDDFNLLIAAAALIHDLTLVTRDIKHFGRIPGIKIIS